MSIVRMGMAEDGKFSDGYETIFGKKKPAGDTAKAKGEADRKKKDKKPKKKK
jgi:hypothetical protein